MKICYLAGANSVHSYRWIKYFFENGYEIVWISLAPVEFKLPQGIDYHEINTGSDPIGILRAVLKIRKIIAKTKPNILHIHSVGTYGVLALFSRFVPVIATAWGSDVIYGGKSFFKRQFIVRILQRAKIITCDALHMCEKIRQFGIPAERIHLVNFGIDTRQFFPQPPSSSIREMYQLRNAPTIVSLRNFEPVYDIATLLKAVPQVLSKYPGVKLILVGHGSLENALKNMVNQLNIKHVVNFVGFVPNDRLHDVLCSMDIYVSTSLSDAGIAASTAEAMSCGLPVIVTSSGENNQWIEDGKNGFLIPVGQFKVLADRIICLLDNMELRYSFGQAGRATILARNDYRREMAKMHLLYQKTIEDI